MKNKLFTLILFLLSLQLFASVDRKQLEIRLQADYGSDDVTTIYFDYGVNLTYSANEDVTKSMINIGGIPNIFSYTSDGRKCSTNGYSDLSQSAVIGLGMVIDSNSLYTFTLAQFYHFDSSTLVILEDRQLNVFTEMQSNFYQVALTRADTVGRFFLHVTRAVRYTPIAAGCANNDGNIVVSADSSIVWNSVSIMDTSGAVINSVNNAQGAFTFNGLAEGNYKVSFSYNNYAYTQKVFVDGHYITSDFSFSPGSAVVGENINFISSTINTTDYVWYFGDSSIETGVANPSFFYYLPGTYTITLVCSNSFGCSAEVQKTITITEATGITTPAAAAISVVNLGKQTVQVTMPDVKPGVTELDVYNILGQSIFSSPVTNNEMQVSLAGQPTGVYLVSVKNGSKSTTVKVYIAN